MGRGNLQILGDFGSWHHPTSRDKRMVRKFANGLGDLGSIPGQIIPKTKKIPPCLTLSITRYASRVKWSNPGNGVAPSPSPLCSSYWKRSLRVILDYGRQLYFRRTRKLLEKKKLYNSDIMKRKEYLGCLPGKILGIIFEVNQRRTWTNGPENKN